MIVEKPNERITRRYNAKIPKFGSGTFYVTTQRLCFESEKHGLCFDLGFDQALDWIEKKNALQIRWYEEKKLFSVNVEFLKKEGIKPTVLDVRDSITFGYIEGNPSGPSATGFYTDDKNNLKNHFAPRTKFRNVEDANLFPSMLAVTWQDELEDRDGTTLLDQDKFKYMTLYFTSIFTDNIQVNNLYAPLTDSEKDNEVKEWIKTIETSFKNVSTDYFELQEKVNVAKKNNDTEFLNKKYFAWDCYLVFDEKEKMGALAFPGGTMEQLAKYYYMYLMVWGNIIKLIRTKVFTNKYMLVRYTTNLYWKLQAAYLDGKDISTIGDNVKSQDAFKKSYADIAEYRKKLTEVV